jgi:hypothetical protein
MCAACCSTAAPAGVKPGTASVVESVRRGVDVRSVSRAILSVILSYDCLLMGIIPIGWPPARATRTKVESNQARELCAQAQEISMSYTRTGQTDDGAPISSLNHDEPMEETD